MYLYIALAVASLARGVFLLNNVKASIIDFEIKHHIFFLNEYREFALTVYKSDFVNFCLSGASTIKYKFKNEIISFSKKSIYQLPTQTNRLLTS